MSATAETYLSVEDVAKRLGLESNDTNRRFVRRQITTQMQHEHLGRRLRVTEAEFNRWDAARKRQPARGAA